MIHESDFKKIAKIFEEIIPKDILYNNMKQETQLTEDTFIRLGFIKVRPFYFISGAFEIGLDGADFVDSLWTIRNTDKKLLAKIKYESDLQKILDDEAS